MKTSKLHITNYLRGESHRPHKGSAMQKAFLCHDVIINPLIPADPWPLWTMMCGRRWLVGSTRSGYQMIPHKWPKGSVGWKTVLNTGIIWRSSDWTPATRKTLMWPFWEHCWKVYIQPDICVRYWVLTVLRLCANCKIKYGFHVSVCEMARWLHGAVHVLKIWPSCCFYVPREARNVKAARGSDLKRTIVYGENENSHCIASMKSRVTTCSLFGNTESVNRFTRTMTISYRTTTMK